MVSSGTNERAARHKRLGQSIEMVSHKINAPIKIPSTCIADALMPGNAGKNLKPNMQHRAATIEIIRFISTPKVRNFFKLQNIF
ncbi:hypothetical protein HMPREF9554_02269 [Treponema phagedenis F0421]|nr:hypothetical protein HMPREF9554_02269 [Treponema phagedenis F0421]